MLLKNKIAIKTKVTALDLTADDWELFDGYETEAEYLNAYFMECVNDGHDRYDTLLKMRELMLRLSYSGATDSEPLNVLEFLIDTVYGECRS